MVLAQCHQLAQLKITDGNAFSFTQSITAGDTAITSAPTVGEVSAFSNQVSLTAGSAGSLAGTVTTGGALTITAGGGSNQWHWSICK